MYTVIVQTDKSSPWKVISMFDNLADATSVFDAVRDDHHKTQLWVGIQGGQMIMEATNAD